MLQLWIVRHAIAADRAAASDLDFDRPLTNKGRRRFSALAEWLVEHRDPPAVILTSPLVRCVQTAELLADAVGSKKKSVEVSEVLAPGVNLDRLLEVIKQGDPGIVAIVGHEPDMSRCTSELIGGGQIAFGKGHVACITFDDQPARGAGRLNWFVDPKLAG